MRQWTLAAAACALAGAALWHLPATAQHTPPAAIPLPANTETGAAPGVAAQAPRAAAPQLITFDEYRDFRLRDIAERRARLARALAAPNLPAYEKTDLEARKAYYDRLAAMPPDQRDRLFHARFDLIDTDHDGLIDDAERAAWRERQRAHYRELAAERGAAESGDHWRFPDRELAAQHPVGDGGR
jgi:hypothetical protein